MNTLKNFLRIFDSPLSLLGVEFLNKALAFLVVPFLAFVQGVDELAVFSIGLGVHQLIVMVAGYSSNSYVAIKGVTKSSSYSVNFLVSTYCFIILNSTLLSIVILLINNIYSYFLLFDLLMICISAVFCSVNINNLAFYRSSFDYIVPAGIQYTITMLYYSLFFYLVYSSMSGWSVRFYCSGAGFLLLFIVNLVYLKRSLFVTFNFRLLRRHLLILYSYGNRLLIHVLSNWARTNLDRFLITYYFSTTIAASYFYSNQIILAIITFWVLISQMVQPFVYRYASSNDSQIIWTYALYFLFGVLNIFLVVVVIIYNNAELIFPDNMKQSSDFLFAFSPMLIFTPLYLYFSHILYFNKNNMFISYTSLFVSFFQVGVMILLILLDSNYIYFAFLMSLVSFFQFIITFVKARSLLKTGVV